MKNHEGYCISKEKSFYNLTPYHVILRRINANERLFGIVSTWKEEYVGG